VEFKVSMEDIHSCQICHSAVWNNGATNNAGTERETDTLLRIACGFRSVLLAKLHTEIMTNLWWSHVTECWIFVDDSVPNIEIGRQLTL
jgi:hypothetical protein